MGLFSKNKETKICKNCKTESDAEYDFCPNCGAEIVFTEEETKLILKMKEKPHTFSLKFHGIKTGREDKLNLFPLSNPKFNRDAHTVKFAGKLHIEPEGLKAVENLRGRTLNILWSQIATVDYNSRSNRVNVTLTNGYSGYFQGMLNPLKGLKSDTSKGLYFLIKEFKTGKLPEVVELTQA